jgi:hypothetical protein
MPIRQKIASIHLISTIWFIICVGYISGLAMLQAGVQWWIVFSLSFHGILLALLLISIYLFAIFRGISSSQKLQTEHPITKTDYYAVFYAATPFLGSLAGLLGLMGTEETTKQFISGITLATLGMTFLVWVIVDPTIGMLEMLLPESRSHYAARQAETKKTKEKKQKDREHLLAEALKKNTSNHHLWHKDLRPQADKLASLLSADIPNFKQAELEVTGIGLNAWQMGGLNCMRELHNMTMEICRQNNRNKETVDYITYWWDGIGEWRDTSLC